MPAKSDIKAAEAIATGIDKVVQRTLDAIGVATKQDIKALEARIEKLEAWAGPALAKRKPGRPPGSKNKKKAAGKPRGKKPAAKKGAA
jgi:hypothetical protein